MSNLNLFDALEICLQALDQGGDIESCLVRFPELADELRPILTAAVQASAVSAPAVPADVARRGKARVLQAAAEMREQRIVTPVLPFWRRRGFFGARFARLAVSFAAVITFLLTGGTGLVNASSSSLPGDHLYPVKRSWEGVRLFFVFDSHAKDQLEQEFDHERVQEIEELYSEKRIAEVNFQGIVQTQDSGKWVIDGVNVITSTDTMLDSDILPGAVVQVIGETDDGRIKARRIVLIALPGITPSPTFTSMPTFTHIPAFTEVPDTKEAPSGGETENENGSAATVAPTQNGDDGAGWVLWTATPRPDKNNDGSGSDAGSSSNSTPSSDSHHHDDGNEHSTPRPGDGEHHDQNNSTPAPTENHQ